jgi:hypothetical protein
MRNVRINKRNWTEAELARFARAWREVKVTDEYCPVCGYWIVALRGWLKAEQEEKEGMESVPDEQGPPHDYYHAGCVLHLPLSASIAAHKRNGPAARWRPRPELAKALGRSLTNQQKPFRKYFRITAEPLK